MSLFWRAFSINAAVIVVAAIVLAATPGHIDFPGSVSDAIAALVVLALVLGANLVLLRPLFAPLRRLAGLMRQIALLPPGQRLTVAGKGEIAVLGSTFNEMLTRLEAQRQEALALSLAPQAQGRRGGGRPHHART